MAQRILSARVLAWGSLALALGGCIPASGTGTSDGAILEAVAPAGVGAPQAAASALDSARGVRTDVNQLATLTAPLNADGTMGSGCEPQEAEALPDGTWFVFASSMTAEGADVDVACMFGEGSDPWQMRREASDGAAGWPNHVVTNDVVNSIHVEVDPRVVAYLAASGWEPVDAVAALEASLPVSPGQFAAMWIVVTDSVITEVVEPLRVSTD